MIDLMKRRHSVRQYKDKIIDEEIVNKINLKIEEVNKLSNATFDVVYNDSKTFDSFLSHYGHFRNVTNYLICYGEQFDVGYYGEMLVLYLQSLGLNSCWVGLSYSKKEAKKHMKNGKKIVIVICFGYGKIGGFAHRNKDISKIVKIVGDKPEYLDLGIEACMLAPTAMNQQKFKIESINGKVKIKKTGIGPYIKLDLGIVTYHFECVTNVMVK